MERAMLALGTRRFRSPVRPALRELVLVQCGPMIETNSPDLGSGHTAEVESGSRYRFGENCPRSVDSIDEGCLRMAEHSLVQMLDCADLAGKAFLYVGSGSGLFSLAARRLGALVFSFDRDPQSIACTAELWRRYSPDDTDWVVELGTVLDDSDLDTLGRRDIVYSRGSSHHTGQTWTALRNVARLPAPNTNLATVFGGQSARLVLPRCGRLGGWPAVRGGETGADLRFLSRSRLRTREDENLRRGPRLQ